MSADMNMEALAKVNQRFVDPFQTLPAVTLPDGSKLRTGTVSRLLSNIKMYDRVCQGEVVQGTLAAFDMGS